MKICLYAIAKDEIKEVDSWYESMKEADEIIVLDTGSTDGTPERLRELGVTVYEKTYPKPFRFDVARNDSVELAYQTNDLVRNLKDVFPNKVDVQINSMDKPLELV